jgi:hypothetical protein
MNYGRSGMHYWNEYVFEGYVNHRDDMIILAGYPDIPLSRPQKPTPDRVLASLSDVSLPDSFPESPLTQPMRRVLLIWRSWS